MYALLYAGDEDEDGNAKFTPEEALQAAEAANGRVKHDDSEIADTAETTESDVDSSEVEEQPKQNNMNSIYLLLGAVALIGVGGAGFFMMKKKNGTKAVIQDEPDEDDDVEISEDEEYDFYDNKNDE